MPIVQAYKCPRTRKLFEDKAKYVVHLKKLARESLRDKDSHPRMSILQRKLNVMRMSVNSFEDIGRWFEAHPRLLRDLTIRFDHRNGAASKTDSSISEILFYNVEHVPYMSNERYHPEHCEHKGSTTRGATAYYPGIKADLRYNCSDDIRLAEIIRNMCQIAVHSGGSGHFTDYRYDIVMFAEDWPFIGAHFLYEANKADTFDSQHARIIKYAFPGITEEHYLRIQNAGLFPDNENDFKALMMQYTGVNQRVDLGLTNNLLDSLSVEIA